VLNGKRGRAAAFLLSGTLIMGTAVYASAGAAQASEFAAAPRVSQAYTDAYTPSVAYTNPTGDLPVGSWLDANGNKHTSRVYVTYDLSNYHNDVHLLLARLFFAESKAPNCNRIVQVWQTKAPHGPITWAKPPAETALLASFGPTQFCPVPYANFDVTAAALAATAKAKAGFSIEIRLTAADEGNPAMGIAISGGNGVSLEATYNTPPQVPTALYADYLSCAKSPDKAKYLGDSTPLLEARLFDADAADFLLTGDFAIWPADHPDQRYEFQQPDLFNSNTRLTGTRVPEQLTDGVTYGWQVRADDGTDQSAWSRSCYFTLDLTRPTTPTAVSPNYPPNVVSPGGVPVKFAFTPNGATDVIGYQYSWSNSQSVIGWSIGPDGLPIPPNPFTDKQIAVKAKRDGTATVSLIPPPYGFDTLYVQSIDHAFNTSGVTQYTFRFGDTEPTITPLGTAQFDEPITLKLSPNPAVGKVASYTVQDNSGTPQTIPARADGTATVTFTLNSLYGDSITVVSNSVNGWISPTARWHQEFDTTPTVTSADYPEGASSGGVGSPGTFTFTSPIAATASFTYHFDGDDAVTVPATGATAQATWVPTSSGFHLLTVFGTTPDGVDMQPYYYVFFVN
jgi:hypothetical protein